MIKLSFYFMVAALTGLNVAALGAADDTAAAIAPWRCLVSYDQDVGEGVRRTTLYAVDLTCGDATALAAFDDLHVWGAAFDAAGQHVVVAATVSRKEEEGVKFYLLPAAGAEPELLHEETQAPTQYDGPGIFISYDGLLYVLPYVDVVRGRDDVFYFSVQGGEVDAGGDRWLLHWTRFFRYDPGTGDVEGYHQEPCHAFLALNAEGEAPFYYTQDPTGYDERLAFGRLDADTGEMITLGYRARVDNTACPFGAYEAVADEGGPLYYVADRGDEAGSLASHAYVAVPRAAGDYREVVVLGAAPSAIRYSPSRRAVVSLPTDRAAPTLVIQDLAGEVVGEVELPAAGAEPDSFAYDLLWVE